MTAILSYQDLDVWKQSRQLVSEVYRLCKLLPKDEQFGLVSQLRRCAVSIPSNIAEGYHRSSRKEYRRFIQPAYASCAELETQIMMVQRLSFADSEVLQPIMKEVQILMKMLNVLAQRLR